jgi:hypothetical protein
VFRGCITFRVYLTRLFEFDQFLRIKACYRYIVIARPFRREHLDLEIVWSPIVIDHEDVYD